MSLLDNWISEVKLAFQHERPNGNILNWDSDRYFFNIKDKCIGCEIQNLTDFNYSYCNTYQVIPETNSSKYSYVLVIKISYIVHAYSIYWVRYSKNLERGSVIGSEQLDVSNNPETKILDFMHKNNFYELKNEWSEIPISNVELELSEVATLEKCLFDDFEE